MQPHYTTVCKSCLIANRKKKNESLTDHDDIEMVSDGTDDEIERKIADLEKF